MELVRFPDNPPPSAASRPQSGNKILGWSFLASLLINAGVGLWLGFAHLGGNTQAVSEQPRAKIQLYRPPVALPKKPKVIPVLPKPVLPKHTRMPLPPKPVRQAQAKPPVRMAALPPRTIPSPTRSAAPTVAPSLAPRVTTAPTRTVSPRLAPAPVLRPAIKTNASPTVSVTPMTDPARIAVLQNPGRETTPATTVPQKPVLQAPAPPKSAPVQEEPVKTAPPVQPAVRQEPVRPQNYRDVTSQEAQLTNIPQPDTNGIDPSTLTNNCVISFEIDENGHISGARVKQRSGNPDFDDACLKAIRRARGVPAIQDHIAYSQRREHTFQTN